MMRRSIHILPLTRLSTLPSPPFAPLATHLASTLASTLAIHPTLHPGILDDLRSTMRTHFADRQVASNCRPATRDNSTLCPHMSKCPKQLGSKSA